MDEAPLDRLHVLIADGITADEAFSRLRRARNTNHTLNDVAEAVTVSYPLFRAPGPAADQAAG